MTIYLVVEEIGPTTEELNFSVKEYAAGPAYIIHGAFSNLDDARAAISVIANKEAMDWEIKFPLELKDYPSWVDIDNPTWDHHYDYPGYEVLTSFYHAVPVEMEE